MTSTRPSTLLPLTIGAASLAILAIAATACAPHHGGGYGSTIGHSEPRETPPVAEDRAIVTRDLGAVASDACDATPLVKQAGERCRRVAAVAATGSEPSTSASAFDVSTCTVWSAGGAAPRFVAIDFGAMKVVTGLVLVTEMTPPGAAKHVVESSDDGSTWKIVYVIEGEMATAHAYVVPFQQAVTSRYLRITTERSTSPVAWREIVPLDCT